ncbi:lysine N(6)-hydroxylase/L-ornithine N(5)-oxygenase family protein [Spongiactinospora sp. TRM90649]|uniref:lysine N(6)-hydroxylase/L-ornithine N(5)-oxygenase family protein n=1 Tax=Spongiactinospora sp. TRM90649 TaxID=3031114 RepID=UPI0023F9FAE6|nr:lysine N(6)-hydroxylase/L-ornithine N(5)-oxygenase family protein [Spongiactinospora sp. TRM90649]MDF5758249.1 lysine N(6)-hydroxylase/L-ornithine N(5)-oxygenase family protein [Spongiactinospora sp. TRM90649]
MSIPVHGPVHDVVGIGFGPSNLALAVALEEEYGSGVNAVFFERQPGFGWHRGMLIDGATMQVHFLKDLVTLRNPASGYSFLSYLRERGRLVDFINHKTMFPTRLEFHDYLEWVAASFEGLVRYGSEVVSVRPADDDTLEVVVQRDGELHTCLTRNIVVAVGLEPVLPDGVRAGERIWHTEDLLTRLSALRGPDPRRFIVVGAGQSAAEAVEHLHRTYASAEVCAVFTRYGYSPADDSSFANRIFDPLAVDHFYAAPDEVKRMLFAYSRNTNYSVVDLDLIDELYRRSYAEKVAGRERLRILNASRLLDVRADADAVRVKVHFLPTGEVTAIEADAVVYATGYRERDPLDLLGEARAHCRVREGGGPVVERDYRIATDSDHTWGIYLQGATEDTHGIASSLLSMTAVRTGEIVQSIARRSARVPEGAQQ